MLTLAAQLQALQARMSPLSRRWGAAAVVVLVGVALVGVWAWFSPVNWLALVPWPSVGGALLIFGLRLTDVPIGTVRTVMMVRGMRGWATVLGFVEVSLWVFAIGRVMGQLDNLWNILGYAAGYSTGTWLGMWLESRLAFGSVEVHTISLDKSAEVATAIRAAGYGVTQFQGLGQTGPVSIVGVVAQRKHLGRLLQHIGAIDPHAFITVDDTRQVHGGWQLAR